MSSDDPRVIGGQPPHFDGPNLGVDNRRSEIFWAAVTTTRMPMIVSDPRLEDCPVVFCNAAFEQMTGYSHNEIIGRNCRFLQGRDTDAGEVAKVRSAIAERHEIAVELLNYRKDGTMFWNALFLSPVFDASDDVIYFFGSQLDVTRRRNAEDSLRQAQKMEAIGRLTGGIAHDFNNLLQVIMGYAEMAEFGSLAPKTASHIANIKGAVERASSLTSKLLTFSRKQKLEGRVVVVNDIVKNMKDMLIRSVGDDIDIVFKETPGPWKTRIDPVQAEIAILNIVINARDAIRDRLDGGGKIAIRVSNLTLDAGEQFVAVAIRDDGCGMSAENLARATEPFFTTKPEGKGTGLGLSTVYGFMRQSGGGIEMTSTVGEGTEVELRFPRSIETAPEAIETAVAKQPPQGQSILFVDDRDDIRLVVATLLEEAGYRVVSANGGPEALEIVKDAKCPINLLFTDIAMPRMDGVTLATEARKARPDLAVLLTSGNAPAGSLGGFDLIPKPWKTDEMLEAVRDALDRRETG